MMKPEMYDMCLDLDAREQDDTSKNFAIGTRIQRSMSAPPMAEHVGRLPPPMYALTEYDDPQMVRTPHGTSMKEKTQDPHMHPEYYYYYAPKSHNPRLPMSYHNWEARQQQFQHRNSSLHRVQLAERRRGEKAIDNVSLNLTTTSSKEDFEAAVAAAGGHAIKKIHGEHYCLSPTESSDSNSSSSIRPVTKTLIDRIQEDFPRTPSPVFGYGMQIASHEDPHLSRLADQVALHGEHYSEIPAEIVQSMKRLQMSGDAGKGRINMVHSHHYPSTPPPPPGMHYGSNHTSQVLYDRYHRAMHQTSFYTPDRLYHDTYEPVAMQDMRLLSTPKAYYEHEPTYNRHFVPVHHHPAAGLRSSLPWKPDAARDYSYAHPMEEMQQDKTFREKAKPSQPSTPLHQSILLDDFRATVKTKQWELIDARGHIVEFAKDQHGSRFIQQKLETAKTDIKDIVFSEVFPVALALMTDVFGNYVVQKFFDHGNPDHVLQLMHIINGRMIDLALQMYGCRVIQKALESDYHAEKLELICELEGQVLRCVKDQNANHVVQKCIEVLPWKDPSASRYIERASFLLAAFEGNVYSMATHPYGCRVIQRVLEHCSDVQMATILVEIQDACSLLVEDQYGNYVIQHVLQHGQPAERSALINKIYPDIVRFSYHKFASNVIEKCLMYASVEQLHVIMRHVMDASDGECPLQVMMKDQYANYVVQKLIDVADASERDKMVAIIKTQATLLKRFTFGKHILNRLEKLTGYKMM
ncbi:hypothetical protein Ae201684P_019363 [Aphanomyces euteiches]|nr:hypothetical protein Ae201684P_019363 [Aphanomyces euteiches]